MQYKASQVTCAKYFLFRCVLMYLGGHRAPFTGLGHLCLNSTILAGLLPRRHQKDPTMTCFFSFFLPCREFTLFTVFRSTLVVSVSAFQNIWIESAAKISQVCHQPIFVLRKRLMWEQTRPVLGHVFMASTFLPYRLMAKTWVTK